MSETLRHDLGMFALDFIEDLDDHRVFDDEEIVTAVFALQHRGEDGEVKFAYRTITSRTPDNVELAMDILKAELQRPE